MFIANLFNSESSWLSICCWDMFSNLWIRFAFIIIKSKHLLSHRLVYLFKTAFLKRITAEIKEIRRNRNMSCALLSIRYVFHLMEWLWSFKSHEKQTNKKTLENFSQSLCWWVVAWVEKWKIHAKGKNWRLSYVYLR